MSNINFDDIEIPKIPDFTKNPKKLRTSKVRRKVRKVYTELGRLSHIHRKAFSQPHAGEIVGKCINSQNKLFQSVTHAREGSMDSQLLDKNSEFLVRQAIAIGESKIDLDSFVLNLFLKYRKNSSSGDEEDEFDWGKLGKDVCKNFMRPPCVQFMNGSIGVKKKKRRKGKRIKRIEGVGEKPTINEEEEKKKRRRKYSFRLKKKYKNLKENDENVNFLDLCVDKGEKGFTKTIENIFYYSFLIKENRASLELNKNGELLCNINKEMEDEVEEKPEKRQFVFHLNLENYKKMVKKIEKKNQKRINKKRKRGKDSKELKRKKKSKK